ncbi:HAMP domain-containing sensor histidine kinase [Sinanaerobacter sp. ZZT-01]|uniref:sensor histidine kinase n=1 Tax=Sinanaerobacter sp. ZZT-01 TaxID=3111540 RepID=UPI002D7851D8|nr:HAMP domain-containing sensor histidine kinase [Sinanaerobacter sp. ZZT-01]WRR93822.1 HAMP domain-containing sensor histidine kinase [Sinanaerobacter sp. ZZT-01]
MKKNLSTRGIYIGVGAAFLVLMVCFYIILFYNTKNRIILGSAIIFPLLVLLLGITLISLIKGKLTAFSDSLNACIDDIVSGKEDVTFELESETLIGKFNHKLQRLYEIMQNGKRQVQEEKQSIQEMISDISHQVKTPMANLKMYNSTLLERQLTPEKAQEFHERMKSQIDKLDFLMQAMVKMSRLETGVITLTISPAPIYDTIGLALSGIERTADRKKMEVTVDCNPAIIVPHDKKWTAEALFNILDNAVKYTPSGGRLSVMVERWEMATKIDITDTGRGIHEQHYAQIFKRFYREDEVHEFSGIGVGLYLCREIISKQGGYIHVKSEIGKGSTFSVFLPNERQL